MALIGKARAVDRKAIAWPSGVRQEIRAVPVGRYVTVVETGLMTARFRLRNVLTVD